MNVPGVSKAHQLKVSALVNPLKYACPRIPVGSGQHAFSPSFPCHGYEHGPVTSLCQHGVTFGEFVSNFSLTSRCTVSLYLFLALLKAECKDMNDSTLKNKT